MTTCKDDQQTTVIDEDDFAVHWTEAINDECHLKQIKGFQNDEDEEGTDYFDVTNNVSHWTNREDVEQKEEEGLTSIEHQYEIQHYDKHMALCTCSKKYGSSCMTNERKQNALKFAEMDEEQRKNAASTMPFILSAPKNVTNVLIRQYHQQERKRRKQDPKQNISTAYVILGQRVCQEVFCVVVQLSRKTVNKLAVDVVEKGIIQRS